MNFSKGNRQFAIKLFSGRLNIRPYNKLDKEVIDFKEYKKGLTTPHNTKCFYLGARTSQE